MLVKGRDRLCDRFRESKLTSDVGATRTTGPYKIGGDRTRVSQDPHDRSGTSGEVLATGCVAQQEVQAGCRARRDQLEVVFKRLVVGLIQFGDPRGVAAAAKVLQKSRIVDRAALGGVQPQYQGDLTRNPACPQ